MFREQKRNGELRAENVRFKGKGKEVFRVRITFEQGQDLTCVIEAPNGVLCAEGEPAKQLLARAGIIEWDWIAKPYPNTSVSGIIPQLHEGKIVFKKGQVNQELLSLVPRPYQHLFLLVDGTRTVAQIAAFFPHTTIHEVYKALVEMHKRGWLTL